MITAKLTTLTCISYLLFLLYPMGLYGQSELHYSGPFQVDDYRGAAEFTYHIEEGDTVFNGPFQLRQANLDSLLAGNDQFFSFKGSFRNNSPNNSWQFLFGDFQVGDGAVELVDDHYQVDLNGTEHTASGSMNSGKPDGEWIHTVKVLENSEVKEIAFKSTIQFENGVPQRSFRIENQHLTLLGRFLRDGLAHDVWELYSDSVPGAMENWYFVNGRLEKIALNRNDQTEILQAYANEIDNPREIILDDRYIEVIKLRQLLLGQSDIELEGGMNKLLSENARHYQKIDNILSELGDSEFMPEFKVKAAYYPLDEAELKQLDSIRYWYKKSDSVSHKLLKNTQLNIIKLSDEEVFFQLSVVSKIKEQNLPILNKVVQYHEKSVLDYVSKDNLLTALWPAGQPSTTIEVRYNSSENKKSFLGPDAANINLESAGINAVYDFARYTWQSVDSIQGVLNEKLKNKERQEELEELEEQLITAMTQLTEITDSLANDISGEPARALQSVKNTANQELSRYSAIEDMAIKPDHARQLVHCFKEMNQLAVTTSKLPARWDEIQEEYREDVWNPFTSTLMSEDVKKRITDAYKKVLIPHFLYQINNHLSCQNTKELNAQLESSYQRLLEMKNEDTSRMERKLKSEQDPQVIMQLFNITPKSKVIQP